MDNIQVGDVYRLSDKHNQPDRVFTVKELRPGPRHVVLEDSLRNGKGNLYMHTVHLATLRSMFKIYTVNVLPYSHRS